MTNRNTRVIFLVLSLCGCFNNTKDRKQLKLDDIIPKESIISSQNLEETQKKIEEFKQKELKDLAKLKSISVQQEIENRESDEQILEIINKLKKSLDSDPIDIETIKSLPQEDIDILLKSKSDEVAFTLVPILLEAIFSDDSELYKKYMPSKSKNPVLYKKTSAIKINIKKMKMGTTEAFVYHHFGIIPVDNGDSGARGVLEQYINSEGGWFLKAALISYETSENIGSKILDTASVASDYISKNLSKVKEKAWYKEVEKQGADIYKRSKTYIKSYLDDYKEEFKKYKNENGKSLFTLAKSVESSTSIFDLLKASGQSLIEHYINKYAPIYSGDIIANFTLISMLQYCPHTKIFTALVPIFTKINIEKINKFNKNILEYLIQTKNLIAVSYKKVMREIHKRSILGTNLDKLKNNYISKNDLNQVVEGLPACQCDIPTLLKIYMIIKFSKGNKQKQNDQDEDQDKKEKLKKIEIEIYIRLFLLSFPDWIYIASSNHNDDTIKKQVQNYQKQFKELFPNHNNNIIKNLEQYMIEKSENSISILSSEDDLNKAKTSLLFDKDKEASIPEKDTKINRKLMPCIKRIENALTFLKAFKSFTEIDL